MPLFGIAGLAFVYIAYLDSALVLAEVVPEFDLPGHSQAAIASYPDLGNFDSSEHWEPQVATSFGALPYTLSPCEKSVNFTKDRPDASSFQRAWPSLPMLSHLDEIMSHPTGSLRQWFFHLLRRLQGIWKCGNYTGSLDKCIEFRKASQRAQ